MTLAHKMLLGLLLIQAGLAAWTWWPTNAQRHAVVDLVPFDADDVTRVALEGSSAASAKPVVLERRETGWVVASESDYPARHAAVGEIVERLVDLEVRRPVASTPSAFETLQVGDTDYTRRVVVTAGEASRTLLFGGASGSKAYVRAAGADAAYLANTLSVWSIGDNPQRYLDRQIVTLDPAAVTEFSIQRTDNRIELTRAGETWTTPDETNRPISPERVLTVLEILEVLEAGRVMGRAPQPTAGLDEGITLTWKTGDDGGSLRFGPDQEETWTPVQVEGSDFVVEVPVNRLKRFRTLTLADLLQPESEAAAPAD